MKTERKKGDLRAFERERIVSGVRSLLLGSYGDVIAAYVSGSFDGARGFKDVDIGLLFRRVPDGREECERRLEAEFQDLLGIPTNVRILNNAPAEFFRSVMREGVLILDLDPNARAAFEERVLKKFFHFAFFKRRYLKGALHAPI